MGLGDDYNEDLLQAMAMSGDGNYYYITDAEQLPGIFERELQGLASTLGTAVTLALEPLGQVQVADVLNDLEVDGQGRFKLTNLVYGSPLDVVVRLNIPAVAPETELCAFTLSWLDTEHQPQSRRVVLTLPAVSQQDYEHLPANELVQQQVALMMAARAKQEAIRRADQGDVQGAQAILSDSSEQLRSFDFAMAAPEMAALNELQEQLGSGKFEVFRKQASSQRYKRSRFSSSGHSDLVYAFQKGPRLGDITQQQVEAIVNSTDRFLSDQGMVSGAIHRAAGPELLAACRQLNGCAVGSAQITPGFNLPAPWVIHTVCPAWQDGHPEVQSLLARCYQACLDLAVAQGIKSIAFPALGCGALGFPPEIAARIAFETVSRYLLSSTAIGTVLFICHDTATLTHFQQAFKRVSAW
jgi:Ca-activated chloride channel family protein